MYQTTFQAKNMYCNLLRNNLRSFRAITSHGLKISASKCPQQGLRQYSKSHPFGVYKVPLRQSGNTTISIKQYESSRKYTGLWKAERFVGTALIFMLPMAFCIESKELEMATAFVATLHTYWGCESMCKDYVRSSVVGKLLPILARSLNISLSVATLYGLYLLIYKDCGIVHMLKKLWAIGVK
ncbi:succinate dehydrogenase [ubiquinone] cytochrome b small subunit, mitochondrial-like [Musca autumnalis]|uniref:succinate dehydrogenase [ubiquinone] cytochrome b small subunit, mitochondrial-like n=1 Tax=Musca autumnalis TaxID=221902 RepID=UPI003CF2827C